MGERSTRIGAVAVSLFVTLSAFALVAMTSASDESPQSEPAPEAVVEDPAHRYQVTAPNGWSVRTDTSSEVTIWPPTGNSAISIRSEPWCSEGTLQHAGELLTADLETYRTNTGFAIFEPIETRLLNGHASAHVVFTHFLAYGRAYQVLAAILGPEWSTGWSYSGLIHDASEIARWDEINATLDSFAVLSGPAAGRMTHADRHFSIAVPPAWEATKDVVSGGDLADAVLLDPLTGTSVIVVSERRALAGTPGEARSILQEAINGFSTQSGFAILEPVADRTVDGRPAAEVYLTWQPSTYNLYTDIVVVVGAEWQRFWALSGSGFSWFGVGARSCFNSTLQSFEVEDAPAGAVIPVFFASYSIWILTAGLAATATEGGVLGYLIVRASRRKR